MKIALLLVLILTGMTAITKAQVADQSELKRVEMKKLEKMAGHWKGTGWMQQGPKRETFTGTETVQSKLDGLATLVEGYFTNSEGKVIHQTLAVLSYDEAQKNYRFATYLANGMTGVQEYKIVGDHFEWGFQIPNAGTVRYTVKIDDTTWFEIGEFSRDGKTWMQNFEMKLTKVK
ncbi:MAG: DUF1579 family protein [Pyrinomonadaceae bacterium]